MNVLTQRHCARFIYIVPDGLRELMSDISREVIRSQPHQIYTFIADYLDALMITRENARIAAKLVESITEIAEMTVNTLIRIGMSREDADRTVVIIQRHFREYLTRHKPQKTETEGEGTDAEIITQRILNELNIDYEKLEEMALIIQEAWHKFKERQEREKQMLFGMVDWRIAARSAIALYRKTGVTRYEANRAATLIKAAYKGYYTRRIMRALLQKGLEQEPGTWDELSEEFQEETVITETAITGEYTETEVTIGEEYFQHDQLDEEDQAGQVTPLISSPFPFYSEVPGEHGLELEIQREEEYGKDQEASPEEGDMEQSVMPDELFESEEGEIEETILIEEKTEITITTTENVTTTDGETTDVEE